MAEPKLTRSQRDQWAEELAGSDAATLAAVVAYRLEKRLGITEKMRAALRAAVRALPVSEEEV